ncbi:MAG: hypothetical protein ACT4QF_04985 [Sporichthyaceae bacterium]
MHRRLRPQESTNWTTIVWPAVACVLPAAVLLACIETAAEAALGVGRGASLVSVGTGLVALPACYALMLRLRHPGYLGAVLRVRAPAPEDSP